jgi:hypothetical protein
LRAGTLQPSGGGEEETLPQVAHKEAEKYLATNPQFILDLVQQDLLPLTDLPRELDDKLEEAASDKDREEASRNPDLDFFCAYSKIAYPPLEKLAVRWIQGDKLSTGEMKDLGLKSPGIDDPKRALRALRFLLEAFRKADIAFMFCLDEFERFTLRGSPQDQAASPGLLKDLTELFKDTGQILVVSGVTDAWDKLPKDVFDRIKREDIVETRLVPGEARKLLGVYLANASQQPEEKFEKAALNLICEVGGDNARRLLSVAHHAFEMAGDSPAPISEAIVQQAAVDALSDAERKQLASRGIEDVALRLRLAITRNVQVGDVVYDFVLGDPGNPAAMVAISQSVFKLDELQTGISIAGSTQVVSQLSPQARTCTVIVGYSTPEVRDRLAKVVDRVFVYDEDHFVPEFEEFLQASLLPLHEVEQKVTSQAAAYKDLLIQFDKLRQDRETELQQLKERVEALQSERQAQEATVREKRASDKLIDALDDLSRLLRSEELLSVRAWKKSWGGIALEPKALEESLRLIDDQRVGIRRAKVLAAGLAGSGERSQLLDQFAHLTDASEDFWKQTYDRAWEKSDQPSTPELFRQRWTELYQSRRATLADLEQLHLSYRRAGVTRFLGLNVPVSARVLLIWIYIATLGVLADGYFLGRAWMRESPVLHRYAGVVDRIGMWAAQMDTVGNPFWSDQGTLQLKDLYNLTSDLDASSTALVAVRYTPLDATLSEQITSSLEKVNSIISDLGELRRAKPTDENFAKMRGEVASLHQQLAALRKYSEKQLAELSTVSFLDFAGRFARLNLSLFLTALLPLFALAALFLRQLPRPTIPGG